MRRNFNFSGPHMRLRILLGVLVAANLVAAAFAFHLFGSSPAALEDSVTVTSTDRNATRARLERARLLNNKIETGKQQSENFLASYMTDRRHTFSLIVGEITATAKQSGMKMGDTSFAALDAIEGSEDLDMLTVTVNLEGGYAELKKFVNLLDRSPRFLIVESLTVAPKPKGDVLSVVVKLNTFVREEQPA